jgi:hypothetical protein
LPSSSQQDMEVVRTTRPIGSMRETSVKAARRHGRQLLTVGS